MLYLLYTEFLKQATEKKMWLQKSEGKYIYSTTLDLLKKIDKSISAVQTCVVQGSTA